MTKRKGFYRMTKAHKQKLAEGHKKKPATSTKPKPAPAVKKIKERKPKKSCARPRRIIVDVEKSQQIRKSLRKKRETTAIKNALFVERMRIAKLQKKEKEANELISNDQNQPTDQSTKPKNKPQRSRKSGGSSNLTSTTPRKPILKKLLQRRIQRFKKTMPPALLECCDITLKNPIPEPTN